MRFKNIDEYHAAQPAEVQDLLWQLRLAIVQAAPMATETISYGMPAFRQNKMLVYYSANKKHIGFYPTPGAIAHFELELKSFSTTKGAIHFMINKPLPIDLIQKIVEFRVTEVENSLNRNVLSGVLHEIPNDMKTALHANAEAREVWNALTPIQRNEWICWVTIVKQSETRAEHIQRMIEELNEGKRKPCCWPGCPHRRSSAKKWFKNIDM